MKVTPPAPCSGASPSGVAQDGLQAHAERFRVIFEEAAKRGLPPHGAALAGTGGLRRRGHLRPAGGQQRS